MKLISAHIYGFGNWVDTTIDFSGHPFLCIHGDNESGKSTLRHFLMFMLFGLPPRKRTFFQPKSSSRMGGRLNVFDEHYGEFTIKRLDQVKNGAAICELKDGQTKEEDWLSKRMNGMTKATYEAIFSFSALDLADIRDMKEDDLGEVLLGIGLTGSSSIHRVEKKLEARLGELFKPSGKKPAINKQLLNLNEQQQMLFKYRKKEETYRDKTRQIEEFNGAISQLQQDLKTTEDDRRFMQKQQDALPLLQAYDECRRKLKAFPEHIQFPDNGVTRFEKLQDQLLPLKGEQAVLKDTAEKQQKTLDAMHEAQYSNDVINRAENLLEEKQTDDKRSYRLNTINKELTSIEGQIQSDIQRLGIGLDTEELEALSLPFGVEKTWQQLKQTAEAFSSKDTRLNAQHRELARENEQLTQHKHQLEGELLDDATSSRLKQQLNDDKEADARAKIAEQQVEQDKVWEQMQQARTRQFTVVSWLVSGLAVICFFTALVSDSLLPAAIGLLLLAIGAGQHIYGRRSVKQMAEMITFSAKEEEERLNPEDREAIETALAKHNRAQQDLRTLKEQERALALKWGKWEDAQQTLTTEHEKLTNDIQNEITAYPFLWNIDVSYWPELFQTLRYLLGRREEKRELYQERHQLQAERETSANRVQQFFEEMNWEQSFYSNETIKQLRVFLDEERSMGKQIADYEQSLADNKTNQQNLEKKIAVYENEKKTLLKQAGAEDEDTFWQQAENMQEKTRLEHEQNDILQQLKNRFSPSQYHHILDTASRDTGEIEKYLHTLQDRYQELEAMLEHKRSERSNLMAELNHMEGDTDLSALMHRFNLESEKLNKMAEEWSVYMTAKCVLAEAKRTYREKHIDHVIAQTGEYFNTVTAGMYTSVHPPSGEQTFRIQRYDGVRFSVGELSQGTLDQLYVSLRLAIGQIMSEQHSVPYIIDDAFVHFDEPRTTRMLGILEDMADNRQVLMFTSKQQMVQALSENKTLHLDETIASASL